MVAKRVRRVLRGYTDLTVIGSGRLWTLYRAFEVESSQWVAMRVIPAGSVEDYLLDELASRINSLQPVSHHPNIATIHRLLRRRDGSVAIVTELCLESLADRLAREGTIPVASALKAAGEAAAALRHLHSAGVAHGDLRPSKLLAARSGATVVEGLGLGALGIATRTPASTVSPHCAPEIFGGTAASSATDVYGLASSLYHLLRGRPAFEAFEGEQPASLILRIVGEPVPPLRAPGVPLATADLIARAMAKDPADRPASVTEFADALKPAGVGQEQPDVPERFDAPARPGVAELSSSQGEGAAGLAPTGTSPVAREARDAGRQVLTPLTAGRGAPPVPVRKAPADRSGMHVTRPDAPRFVDPEPAVTAARPTPLASPAPLVSTAPPDDPRSPDQAADGQPAGRGGVGTLTWALVGVAVALVVLAVIVLAGLL